ncbi:hypothetical protein K439DRAFT_1662647 [Ramaria rubella]|nr:hypothetical protein K439DRAFT_1662647 [Ramaria rubella]
MTLRSKLFDSLLRPTSSESRAMDVLRQVLNIPELLRFIFGYTDERTQVACALVCKTWLEPALDELWRHITTPDVLFRLLAPMHPATKVLEHGYDRWLFSRFILPSDWARFDYYAPRVRYLEYDEAEHQIYIDEAAFTDIARTRLRIVLLPKLRTLRWNTRHLHQSVLFMHQNVTNLVANIDGPFQAGEGFVEVKAFLLDVASRLPNLAILDLRASYSVMRVKGALIPLLRGGTRLKKVVLPRYWFCSAVLSALAGLRHLECLQWEYITQGEGDPTDVELLEVTASDGAFPALLDLSLETNLQDVTALFESSLAPVRLSMFYLRSLRVVPPAEIHHFISTCSTTCHNLTDLSLDLHSNVFEPVPTSHRITLETLEPLFACPNITHLTLMYNTPLAPTDADAEILAKRWPHLVSLQLNDEPSTLTTPTMTLAALLPFAAHCPKLMTLHLYVDATLPPPHTTPSSTPKPFSCIRRLVFGTSPIDAENTIALFLSRICTYESLSAPPTIVIQAGTCWDPSLKRTLPAAVLREVEERREIWEGVGAYLPMLLALRAEERAHVRELEGELEVLRARGMRAGTADDRVL